MNKKATSANVQATIKAQSSTLQSKDAALCLSYQNGEEKAFNELLIRYNDKIRVIAGKINCGHLELADLYQVGAIALSEAALHYSPSSTASFATYAYHTIQNAIMREVLDHGRMIRLPKDKILLQSKIGKARQEYLCTYGEEPLDYELAEMLGMDESELKKAQTDICYVSSYDNYSDEEEDRECYIPQIADSETADGALIAAEETADFQHALDSLPTRTKEIVADHFGFFEETHTDKELGRMYGGISSARIGQIRNEGLTQLRHSPFLLRNSVA